MCTTLIVTLNLFGELPDRSRFTARSGRRLASSAKNQEVRAWHRGHAFNRLLGESLLGRGQAPTEIVGDAVVQAADDRSAAAAHGREAASEAATDNGWSLRPAVVEQGGHTRALGLSHALLGELEGEQGVVVVHGGSGSGLGDQIKMDVGGSAVQRRWSSGIGSRESVPKRSAAAPSDTSPVIRTVIMTIVSMFGLPVSSR
jgi:hypothetical protein